MKLPDEQIQHISEELLGGFICYIHKSTREILALPDLIKFDGYDLEAWEEDQQKVEENILDYYRLEAMTSRDAFKIMEDFANEVVTDFRLKGRLFDALSRRKPFGNFKNIIERDWNYRERWFAFRNQRWFDWVKDEVEMLEEE